MDTQYLQDIIDSMLHLFYPRLCEGCSKPLLAGEEVLCISCSLEIPETNYHQVPENETAIRFAGRIPFKYATSFAWFNNDSLIQHLVHGLKYRNKKETGIYLGKRLGERLRETNWWKEIDIIVPVPLHKTKQAKRGYNQSMLIALGISESMHIPADEHILKRVRDTESQTHKTRAERLRNMEDAFTINNARQLSGKHILICDDVLTTGATLEACALALMVIEGIKISVATIGIASS